MQAKQLVDQFDVDKDGWIDVKEFEVLALQALGEPKRVM